MSQKSLQMSYQNPTDIEFSRLSTQNGANTELLSKNVYTMQKLVDQPSNQTPLLKLQDTTNLFAQDDNNLIKDLTQLPIAANPSERIQQNSMHDRLTNEFSSLLKSEFENRNLWLRFGLTIALSKDSPQSALQAFNECMRIDQDDPLPAMLAAKISLVELNDPNQALRITDEALRRCKNIPSLNGIILSRCYVLASIAHAYLYEQEPISIRQETHLQSSLDMLELALAASPEDHLAYFHKALHKAKQRLYTRAIDILRRAIQIKLHHLPSIELLILCLSALKLYDEALKLCESVLAEYGNDLMLLYIKGNLEQCLVETKDYKVALGTAQQMLKCFKQPNNLLSVWILVAEIFVKIGSVEDAEMCVDEGSIHASGALSHQVMYIRGLIAKAKNLLIEAKTFFQSSLALCPKNSRASQQMAHVHYLLGNYSIAEKFLKDSLDLDPDSYKSWYYLSLVYIEMNQHDRANECVKKSTMLEETSPSVPISAISRLILD